MHDYLYYEESLWSRSSLNNMRKVRTQKTTNTHKTNKTKQKMHTIMPFSWNVIHVSLVLLLWIKFTTNRVLKWICTDLIDRKTCVLIYHVGSYKPYTFYWVPLKRIHTYQTYRRQPTSAFCFQFLERFLSAVGLLLHC